MPQPKRRSIVSNEADINLAITALRSGRVKNPHAAAAAYNVARVTLISRLNGVPPKRDNPAHNRKMTTAQEEEYIKALLDLDERGFAATGDIARDMANAILAADDQPPVGKQWIYRFIKRVPALRMMRSRPYDHQRALCEDPKPIERWFEIVRLTQAKYGIVEDDIYNFDETGFAMGKISAKMVITGTGRRRASKRIQPTVVACGGATG